jgi:hypothetical protein
MVAYFFENYIAPAIRDNGYQSIVEIGVDAGQCSARLLELTKEHECRVICIDPDPSWQPAEDHDNFSLIRKPSLDALKSIKTIDCAIIDGDHNWYTVFNELKVIHPKLKPGGTVFFHDVRWPYARRDMYYEPKRIPGKFRHPFMKMGIVQGSYRLAPEGINGEYYNAVCEGGSQNGVLTAVEDFLRLNDAYELSVVEEEHGLGILRKRPNEG